MMRMILISMKTKSHERWSFENGNIPVNNQLCGKLVALLVDPERSVSLKLTIERMHERDAH